MKLHNYRFHVNLIVRWWLSSALIDEVLVPTNHLPPSHTRWSQPCVSFVSSLTLSFSNLHKQLKPNRCKFYRMLFTQSSPSESTWGLNEDFTINFVVRKFCDDLIFFCKISKNLQIDIGTYCGSWLQAINREKIQVALWVPIFLFFVYCKITKPWNKVSANSFDLKQISWWFEIHAQPPHECVGYKIRLRLLVYLGIRLHPRTSRLRNHMCEYHKSSAKARWLICTFSPLIHPNWSPCLPWLAPLQLQIEKL